MPANQSPYTPEQRERIVALAHERIAAGLSANRAAADTAAEMGVSASTVRRICASAGRPLTPPGTPATRDRLRAARFTQTLMSIDRQRGITQSLLRVLEDEVREIAKREPGETDLLALNRLVNMAARLRDADARLLTALGPRPEESAAEPPAEVKREARELVAEWQRELSEFNAGAE